MATGYTADVKDGKVTEFPRFAMQCARAFGALVLMRDDPFDAPIPDEIAPTPYYADSLVTRRAELARLEALTPVEADDAARLDFEAETERYHERRAERLRVQERYAAMLLQAQAWVPPSADHEGMKRFMVEQLTESIRHDCDGSYDTPPTTRTGQEWLAQRIERAREDVAYAERHNAEEVERAAGRTRWLRQLRESLSGVSAS